MTNLIKLLFYLSICFVFSFFTFLLVIPEIQFNKPYSAVICFSNEEIASARIAKDMQWRFPKSNKIPLKFATSLMMFEDKNFLFHNGIDPASILRAFRQNLNASKIVSGGSTLTMQLARISRENPSRNISDKILEIAMALRHELLNSKTDILIDFCNQAPFGGNIVGIEAASWRYFGKDPNELSWAESACLAVLPNAPSLIYPGKNQSSLLKKRNYLLQKLYIKGILKIDEYNLAKLEELPAKIFSLPHQVDPLMNTILKSDVINQRIITSLDKTTQQQSAQILKFHLQKFQSDQIHNAAILIADIHTGKILAYHGNVPYSQIKNHGEEVDIIQSERSTGSLLKPFLYACMLEDAYLNPEQLIADVPTQIGGFKPQNYNLEYDGMVKAKRALARSLNVPAVKMLQQYGVRKFQDRLKSFGINTIRKSADHYGVSLILGGAEGKLWELCSVYAKMAQKLNGDKEIGLNYFEKSKTSTIENFNIPLRKNNIYQMFEAMAEVNRPDLDASWKRFTNGKKIAWKTGTSFGFRDAWAIGLNKDFIIGVWVGNASGEGRPSLGGISAAAPLLFELFSVLPNRSDWFRKPQDNWKKITLCKSSGFLAGPECDETTTINFDASNNYSFVCPYHKSIALSNDLKFRVNTDCATSSEIVIQNYFVLPPLAEKYYRIKNPTYKTLPPIRPDCITTFEKNMGLIYPQNHTLVYIPRDLNGATTSMIAEAVHKNSNAVIHWSLDGEFIGSTQKLHQMAFNPPKGKHRISISDGNEEIIEVDFEITNDKK